MTIFIRRRRSKPTPYWQRIGGALDLEHLAEEIEALGKEDLWV